jgi:hypothetical protein
VEERLLPGHLLLEDRLGADYQLRLVVAHLLLSII